MAMDWANPTTTIASAPGTRPSTASRVTLDQGTSEIPVGTSPTTSTPLASRSSTGTATSPKTTATRAPGTFGMSRSPPNRISRATAATAMVAVSQSARSRNTPRNCWTVLPSAFSTPNSLFSCPIAMNNPRPTMNPSSTGRAKNRAMNPIRRSPSTM